MTGVQTCALPILLGSEADRAAFVKRVVDQIQTLARRVVGGGPRLASPKSQTGVRKVKVRDAPSASGGGAQSRFWTLFPESDPGPREYRTKVQCVISALSEHLDLIFNRGKSNSQRKPHSMNGIEPYLVGFDARLSVLGEQIGRAHV